MDRQIPPAKPQLVPTERAIDARSTTIKKRKKKPPLRDPLNPFSAMMIFAVVAGNCRDLAHHLGVGTDHPDVRKYADALLKSLEKQYDRKVRAQALRRREDWRKADVPRLLKLPGASEAANHRIAELTENKHSSGHGVVPEPKQFEQAFAEALNVGLRIVDPTKPSDERRELRRKNMPTYAAQIEAAYRGEFEKVRGRTTDKNYPHWSASQLAEHNVAEAAGISAAEVHQHCQHVRDEYKRAERWAAARPGREVKPEPAVTAADLKRHLDRLAELAKLSKP
jgi:hypothetical protein